MVIFLDIDSQFRKYYQLTQITLNAQSNRIFDLEQKLKRQEAFHQAELRRLEAKIKTKELEFESIRELLLKIKEFETQTYNELLNLRGK